MSIPKRARATTKNLNSAATDPRYERALVEQLGQRISQKILGDRETAQKAALIIQRWLKGDIRIQKRKL